LIRGRDYGPPAGIVTDCFWLPAPSSPVGDDPRGALDDAREPNRKVGITIYGCGQDETQLFREMAPRFGIVPTIAAEAVCQDNIELASGNGCISVSHKSDIDESILLGLSEAGVEYISTRSIGYNHIDVKYAESVGICVENVTYSPDSVADYTLMLMLMLVRNAKSTVRRVQAHDYRLHNVRGKELRDMTIGVVGTGRIGSAVMERLEGFGCCLLAYDSSHNTSAEYVSLATLLKASDLVSLHTPLTAETYHLLDGERLDQMRHGAFIVNTGRGPLLDTGALLSALEGGRLGGAALDVLEGEEGIFYSDCRAKTIENREMLRLQRLPNVLITPHTAYYTEHTLSDTVEVTLANCLCFENRRATCPS
jgi:D-specific alpha-keto acid dehydrogenase